MTVTIRDILNAISSQSNQSNVQDLLSILESLYQQLQSIPYSENEPGELGTKDLVQLTRVADRISSEGLIPLCPDWLQSILSNKIIVKTETSMQVLHQCLSLTSSNFQNTAAWPLERLLKRVWLLPITALILFSSDESKLDAWFNSLPPPQVLDALCRLMRPVHNASWQSICGKQLSRRLLIPHGIQIMVDYFVGSLIEGNEDFQSTPSPALLRAFDMLRRILLSVPRQSHSQAAYFQHLGKSLVQLLDSQVAVYRQTAAFLLMNWINGKRAPIYREAALKYVVNVLVAPLMPDHIIALVEQDQSGYYQIMLPWIAPCLQLEDQERDENESISPVLVSNNVLVQAMTRLERLFDATPFPDLLQMQSIWSLFLTPLYALCTLLDTTPHLKQLCSSLRHQCRSLLEKLVQLVLNDSSRTKWFVSLIRQGHETLFPWSASIEGVVILYRPTSERFLQRAVFDVSTLCSWIHSLNAEWLSPVFVQLWKLYTNNEASSLSDTERFSVLQAIVHFTEHFGPQLTQASLSLWHCLIPLLEQTGEVEEDTESDLVLVAMQLLSFIAEDETVWKGEQGQERLDRTLKALIPWQQHLQIKEMAMQVRVLLISRQLGNVTTTSTTLNGATFPLSEKWLANEIILRATPVSVLSSLELALEDIADPLLPVRAHGLTALRRLIEKESKLDPFVIHKIMQLMLLSIQDADSYIYLNAIESLIALCDSQHYAKMILKELVTLFVSKKDSEQDRVRLAEVFMRVIQAVGPLFDKDAALVLPVLQQNVSLEQPLAVRVSSLAVWSTIAQHAPWSLRGGWQSWLCEYCVTCLLVESLDTSFQMPGDEASDKELFELERYLDTIRLRRAAVTCLRYLIEWNQQESHSKRSFLEVVGVGDVSGSGLLDVRNVRDLYRSLKLVAESVHEDQVSRFHARSGLQALRDLIL